MFMNLDHVPDDALIPMLVTCNQCNGKSTLPNGEVCQTCSGEGRITVFASVNALALYIKSFDHGSGSGQV